MPVEITPQTTADAPVTVRLSGTADRDDVNEAVRAIEAAIANGPPIGIVIDMGDLDDASLGALARDARFELSMLSRLDRFARLALVGAPGWIAMLASAGGRLLPDVRVRSFDRGQIGPAADWAKSRDAEEAATRSEPVGPGIIPIEAPYEDVIAFEIDGDITAETTAPIVDRLLAAYDRGGKVDLLARVRRIGRIDWGMLTDKRYRRMKLESLARVNRYAIVGAPDWMEAAARLGARMSGIDVRTFGRDEEAEAWNWLADAERQVA